MSKLIWPFILVLCTTALCAQSRTPEVRPEFTPRNGFSGYSEGTGNLRLFFGKSRPFRVVSRGFDQPDGTFRLDQTVTFQDEPPQTRVWILTTTSPDHYAATLSDAAGQVTAVTRGAHLLLRYRVKGPLVMHQDLELMPDGNTIDNVAKITLFGIPVGHLHESILRKDPAIPSSH